MIEKWLTIIAGIIYTFGHQYICVHISVPSKTEFQYAPKQN